jgi:hypothetical protein
MHLLKIPLQLLSYQSPMKKSSENNLLPITDKSSPAMPSEEELKSETPDIEPPVVKISPPATLGDNVPATVSSVDQIGISSVDLDISKAVEKGISDAKKEDPSMPQDVPEVPKDEVSKENKTESKCSECENERVVVKEEVDVGDGKEGISKVQKGVYT